MNEAELAILNQNVTIPTEEVLKDIEDTKLEIRMIEGQLRLYNMQVENAKDGIERRHRFIAKLDNLLRLRKEENR